MEEIGCRIALAGTDTSLQCHHVTSCALGAVSRRAAPPLDCHVEGACRRGAQAALGKMSGPANGFGGGDGASGLCVVNSAADVAERAGEDGRAQAQPQPSDDSVAPAISSVTLPAEVLTTMTKKKLRAECRRTGVTQNGKSSSEMVADLLAFHMRT